MLTTVQTYINELTGYQVPVEQRSLLAGKGPAMKSLASKIKELWPTLNQDDKALFVGAISRGRFAISTDIWNMFLDAVGIKLPAPAPAPTASPSPAPTATNKVAGEILECCVGINLNQVKDHAMLVNVDGKLQTMNGMILSLINTVSDLRKQVAELQKKTTPRKGAKAKVEDCIELEAV